MFTTEEKLPSWNLARGDIAFANGMDGSAVNYQASNPMHSSPCSTTTRCWPAGLPQARAPALLSEREKEVLGLLAGGSSSPEIALALNLAASTVDVHRRNIMGKLGLHSVAELTQYAVRTGLIVL